MGFKPGGFDGAMGPQTRNAIKAFQRQMGFRVDGKVTDKLIKQLQDARAKGVRAAKVKPQQPRKAKPKPLPKKPIPEPKKPLRSAKAEPSAQAVPDANNKKKITAKSRAALASKPTPEATSQVPVTPAPASSKAVQANPAPTQKAKPASKSAAFTANVPPPPPIDGQTAAELAPPPPPAIALPVVPDTASKAAPSKIELPLPTKAESASKAYDGYYYFADKRRGPKDMLGMRRIRVCVPKGWKADSYMRENRVGVATVTVKETGEQQYKKMRRLLKSSICSALAISANEPKEVIDQYAADLHTITREPNLSPDLIAKTRKEVLSRCEGYAYKFVKCGCAADKYEEMAKARKVAAGAPESIAWRFMRKLRRTDNSACGNEAEIRDYTEKRCVGMGRFDIGKLKKSQPEQNQKYCDCMANKVVEEFRQKRHTFVEHIDRLIDKVGYKNSACP